MLDDYGISCGVGDAATLGKRLDSAYFYSRSLAELAKNGNYDFAKHESDYGDSLQLFYLSDERTHFLTADRDFSTRAKGSTQNSRILYFGDFVQEKRT